MPMIWSSYYPKEKDKLPGVGDVVTYRDRLHPYTVTRRTRRADGQVLVTLQDGDRVIEKERIEVLNWYPQIGDTCNVSAKPYLIWKLPEKDYRMPEWLFQKMTLLSIDGDMATIRNSKNKRMIIPFECLRVLEKVKDANV